MTVYAYVHLGRNSDCLPIVISNVAVRISAIVNYPEICHRLKFSGNLFEFQEISENICYGLETIIYSFPFNWP